jgi:hypothetical protein
MIRPSLTQKETNDKILELVYSTQWDRIIADLFNTYAPLERNKLIEIQRLINEQTK